MKKRKEDYGKWLDNFNYNPVNSLLNSGNEAISAFIRRDLLNEPDSTDGLWQLAGPRRIIRKQRLDGSWKYSTAKDNARLQGYYDQYESFRSLSILVEMFGFNKKQVTVP